MRFEHNYFFVRCKLCFFFLDIIESATFCDLDGEFAEVYNTDAFSLFEFIENHL